jgi:iron complex transport system substrate-binding protein
MRSTAARQSVEAHRNRRAGLRSVGARSLALAALLVATGASRAPMHLGPKPPGVPKRVITLAPSLTETVLALGAGDRLVGVTRFDDSPAVKSLPRVGGYIDPSIEAVLGLAPDLVLAEPSPGNKAAVERLAKLGTPILAVPLTTEAEILDAMREISAALGIAEKGKQLAEQTEARLEAVRRKAAKRPKVRTLIVFGWEPLVVGGPNSFAEALLSTAGGVNAASEAKSPYPTYSAEMAMQVDPQVIVDAADVRVPARERILALPGVREARLVVGTPSLFHPGPRISEAAEELFALLHPEAKP